ncbi:Acetyl-CoA:oxalate CoA-transferase [Paraconexibacter sp. AEG42_29]|uniref:Acetyl-CoA:oxalate CoA-transferase n=1 Tax=Paraconexibacter sp. AEG42_29 TaxID=2997339 RepID=A0AAU7AQM8_9ACTN
MLDASTFLAGPVCCSLLADWGAEVVKVEPRVGDPTREMGGGRVSDGLSALFIAANRGKQSIAVDYTSEPGRAIVARLAAASDLVVHNQRDDVATALGLSRRALSEAGSTAVTCTISAFGPEGAYAGRPALDSMIQAMTGMSALTGDPDGVPMRAGSQVIDVGAGLAAAGASVAALLGRERGLGSRPVSISLFDLGLLYNAGFVTLRSAQGASPPRLGNRSHPLLADQFAAADGFVVLAVWDRRRWTLLCEALGLPDLGADPALAGNDQRLADYPPVRSALQGALSTRTCADVCARLQTVGVLCCVTADLDAVAADPHTRSSGAIYEERRLAGQSVEMAAGPFRLDGRRLIADRPPPRLGEHSAEVMSAWLGASDAECAQLTAAGVLQ